MCRSHQAADGTRLPHSPSGGTKGPEQEGMTIGELMARQVEAANLLVLNKTDLLASAAAAADGRQARQLLRTLNASAEILATEVRMRRVVCGA